MHYLLPTHSQTSEYRSNGLTLWYALVQENMSIGSNFNTNTLLPDWYNLSRMETETIDAYWNRFHTHLRKVQRDPTVKLLPEHVRLQCITTLGEGFTFLVEAVENNCLDPKYLNLKDEMLKQELRDIQQRKRVSKIGTASLFGYANAAKVTENAKKVPDDTTKSIEALKALIAEQAKIGAEQANTFAA